MKSCHHIFAVLLLLSVILWGCSDDEDKTPVSPPPEESPYDTIRVPGETTTLQRAIDVVDTGGVVLVAAGIYSGDGNRDLSFKGKSLRLISESGPAETIIDCGGDSANYHYGISLARGEDSAVIDGFTIRNGYYNNGGAIYMRSTSPLIRNCVFTGNHATVSGGAMHLKSASPQIENCTFAENSSEMAGAGLFLNATSRPVLDHCIIAFSSRERAVYVNDGSSVPQLRYTILYGNNGGDWIDELAAQLGQNGNMSTDPLFCDTASGDFRLQPPSPGAPENNDSDSLIGALGVGCSE